MTPATATPRGKRKAFAEAAPPRDPELLRHEIANVLQGAGKPMHQMAIQAKLRVTVPLWEILQALHHGAQHFAPAGVGTWELREAGRILADQPLPVTDEVRTSKPTPSRSRKSTSGDDAAGAEPKPAPSRSRKSTSPGEQPLGSHAPPKPAPTRSRTSPPRGGAADDDMPWDVPAASDAKRPAAQARAVVPRAPAPASPRVEPVRPVARKPEVPWPVLPLVVEVLRSHGHPMTAHEIKKGVLAAGGDADFEGVLSLGNASSDLVRYPFGRGLYVGLSAWGNEGWEEVAETLWAQARVQMLGSELLDPDAVRAMQAVAQRKGDAHLLEMARHFLAS